MKTIDQELKTISGEFDKEFAYSQDGIYFVEDSHTQADTQDIKDFYESKIRRILKEQRDEIVGNRFILSGFDAHAFVGMILRELGYPDRRIITRNTKPLCEMFFDLIKQHKMQISDKEMRYVDDLRKEASRE